MTFNSLNIEDFLYEFGCIHILCTELNYARKRGEKGDFSVAKIVILFFTFFHFISATKDNCFL